MKNPLDLTGRRIVVTGASSGIGQACAILLSELGARVTIHGRDAVRLAATLAKLHGDGHCVAPFDFSGLDAIPDWLLAEAQRDGAFHGLVHCAGLTSYEPLRSQTATQIEALLRVNTVAALQLAKGFRHRKVHAEKASLVFISSVASLAGMSALSAYTASKGAINAVTRALAIELVREGIRVNCVCPGLVKSGMIEVTERSFSPEQLAEMEKSYPLGLGLPEDVAHAVAFLLADTARWITGTALAVDGGYSSR